MNPMSDDVVSAIEGELKRVIVQSLVLDGVVPEEIDSDAALFGGGLGLDSIDALELAIEIGRRYGVRIKSDDEKNREIFRSVRTLAAFIVAQKALEQGAP
jgi:acyl carrier protein